ncbi:MAG: tRNA (adenosine(37)-N6)-threonylcarbamoyltransferase complex dimerization subunit type 1 TsaB [Microbacterium sp.]
MHLAVDTSLGSTVAVVGADGDVLAEAASDSPRGHAEVIGDLIVAALRDAGADPEDVTGVVAGMGPGPFTGLRIGIAAARAFALGRGVPVLPVVSHDAAALACAEAGHDGRFAIVTDARRRENAVSVYRGLDAHGAPDRASGPELHPQAADLDALLDGCAIVPTPAIRAADLARVAVRRAAAGLPLEADEPLYLRSPDVTSGHVRKRVST